MTNTDALLARAARAYRVMTTATPHMKKSSTNAYFDARRDYAQAMGITMAEASADIRALY